MGGVIMRRLEISEGGKEAMRSSLARTTRREELKAFIGEHCVENLVGSHPFFLALYALLVLQGRERSKGGMGGKRGRWEVGVEVFSEAGGPDWGKDAIRLLKGASFPNSCKDVSGLMGILQVMGCEESILKSAPESVFGPEDDEEEEEEEILSSPTQPFVLPPSLSTSSSSSSNSSFSKYLVQSVEVGKRQPPRVPPHRGSSNMITRDEQLEEGEEEEGRQRAGSDPFSDSSVVFDTTPGAGVAGAVGGGTGGRRERSTSISVPLRSTPLSNSYTPPTSSSEPQSPFDPTPPSTPSRPILPSPIEAQTLFSPLPERRLFILPSYLTNPELVSLALLFPNFITRTLHHISIDSSGIARINSTPGRLESGEGRGVGHGVVGVWEGEGLRDAGWEGGVWERVVGWFKRVVLRR